MRKTVFRSRWQEKLLDRAGEGLETVLSPTEAIEIAQHLDRVGVVNVYLEAAVRQSGGALHLDTANLLRSSGENWRYAPDRGFGSGGVLTLDV